MKNNTVLEEVVEEIAGSDVIPLAKVLRKNKNISEFKLAGMLKKDINTARNMLYRLFEHSMVMFTRKKDKKKGWYVYYWTLNEKQLPYVREELRTRNIARLRERLQRERAAQFFHCQSKCVRLDFDQATEFQFKCPECNELLSMEDNTSKIKELETEITGLEGQKPSVTPAKTAIKLIKTTKRKIKKKKTVKKKHKKR